MHKLFCDRCKKEITDHCDSVTMHYDFPYGSKYDGSEFKVDLCARCFDHIAEMISSECDNDHLIQEFK